LSSKKIKKIDKNKEKIAPEKENRLSSQTSKVNKIPQKITKTKRPLKIIPFFVLDLIKKTTDKISKVPKAKEKINCQGLIGETETC
jgi:hypothetical protein